MCTQYRFFGIAVKFFSRKRTQADIEREFRIPDRLQCILAMTPIQHSSENKFTCLKINPGTEFV